MKKVLPIMVVLIWNLFSTVQVFSQCSICTKTAQQLGDGPAHGLNSGIIYLALIPLLAIGIVGVRWWRDEKKNS